MEGEVVTTQKRTFKRRIRKSRGRGGRCPPHGPIMIAASEVGYYVASCLACGTTGPQREDGWEAKLAFDETIQ